MNAYGAACRFVVLPLADRLTRQCVMRQYAFYAQAQWWPPGRLEAIQNRFLQETVQAAYKETLFYRNLMDERGVAPSEIRSAADLARLPVVTKALLRAAYPDGCTRRTRWPKREYSTSGSTGYPFTLAVDNFSMSIARALMFLRATFSGWNLGDPYLQMGMTLDRGAVKAAKDYLLKASYVSAYDLSDANLDSYLEIIDRKNLKYVMGYAASLFCLAKRAKDVRFNKTLAGVVSWGDNLFGHYRELIETQFGCRVSDTYGCGEGIQVAAQCQEGRYHIFSPHVIVEFVHGEAPVIAGRPGDILLTRLDPGAMPLIRYRIGDVGRAGSREACPCGRGLEVMAGVDGRSTDIVLTPNGNRLIVHFFTGIFEYAKSIETFQVAQYEVNEITVKVVPRGRFDPVEWEKLKAEVIAKGDRDLVVNLEVVQQIPLEASNKRRFVVSHLGETR